MANGIIFGSNVGIWNLQESENVKIGLGTCKDPFLISIYVALRKDTCIVVLIEGVFDTFEECKLFILTLTTRYFGSVVRMEVFWSLKDLSMDNVIATKLEQCFATMDYCNNFRKK
jgi:hypothetical protein